MQKRDYTLQLCMTRVAYIDRFRHFAELPVCSIPQIQGYKNIHKMLRLINIPRILGIEEVELALIYHPQPYHQ